MKRLIIAIIAVIVLFAGCDMGESGPVEITYSVAVGEAFAPFKYIEYTDSDGSVVTVGRTISPWSVTIATSRRGEYTLIASSGDVAALNRTLKIECSNGKSISKNWGMEWGPHSITFVY